VAESAAYCAAVDGADPSPAMAVPINATQAIVLRGRSRGRTFSGNELQYLTAIGPFISSKGCASLGGRDMAARLTALLEVAEILSGVMDLDALIVTIMDRACSLLHSERCSLFLVDIEKQELVSCFQGGLDRKLRVPLSRGIVGHTATTGETINIPDAYNDPRFDQSVDRKTGFKTKMLLTVPIYNNRGEIAGVTEMINKIDDSPFDDEDIRMLVAFNVFCGISLDNTKLYQGSLDLTRQLRSFVELSSNLNTTKTVKDVLDGILSSAAAVIHAARATVYLYDSDTGALDEFLAMGETDSLQQIFALEAVKERALKNYPKEIIAMKLRLQELATSGPPSDLDGMKVSRLGSVFDGGRNSQSQRDLGSDAGDPHARNLIAIPLLASNGKMLGVMELTCAWKITKEDEKLLDCFAVFASVSLEKSELQEIATKGVVESTIKHWIADSERKGFEIPEKLRLGPDKLEQVFTVNFDAPLFDGTGHFKVLWAVFDRFHLLEAFKVTNEKLFKFISAISETYKKVPYHNWRHAVDVTQFVQYEAGIVGLPDMVTAQELFGLIVAAICHDANHDGFTNVYNEKAETPLGILFKNQSVMETHHCSVAIGIISKEESNVFAALNGDDYKAMWTMIITLILSTDMAKHFGFLKDVAARLDEGPLDMTVAHDRLMAMDLILKCADISNVSRPFEMANKWCDVLCEEFFRQGELESTHGMEYTSPLNDRAHLDKAKSQIGFYTFVCLPLYQSAARAMPALQVNVDQVLSNLAVWKAAQTPAAESS
jgi:GAF domain-containing protein